MLVSFDEGGVRQVDGEHRAYFPFAAMSGVELKSRTLRHPAVVALDSAGGSTVLFAGPEALEVHRALLEHLEVRRGRVAAAGPAHWGRGDRELEVWLADVRSPDVGTYRDGSLVPIALAVFEDADADIESRAAAAHVLVTRAGGGDLVRVAKTLAARPLPPLVQVAACLAEGGADLVSEDVFTEAAAFLGDKDRASARSVPMVRSERHTAAAAQARKELADTVPHRGVTPQRHHRKAAGADRDASRWIGKSWGL